MPSTLARLRQRELGGVKERGELVQSTRRSRVTSLSPSTRTQFQELRIPVSALAFESVTSRFLLQGGTHIRIFDLVKHDNTPVGSAMQTIKPIMATAPNQRHEKAISALLWWPMDTGLFLSASYDRRVIAWDTERLIQSKIFTLDDRIYGISVSPTAAHTMIACGTESNMVRMCDLRTGSSTHILKGHRDSVLCVEWSPKDDYILASAGLDGTVRLWDVRSSQSALISLHRDNPKEPPPEDSTHIAHEKMVNGLIFSPDGLSLLSSGDDGVPRLWDTSTGKNLNVIYEGTITNTSRRRIPLSIPTGFGDDPFLLHPSYNSNTYVLDLHTGSAIRPPLGPMLCPISALAWRPGRDEVIIGGSRGDMYLHEPTFGAGHLVQGTGAGEDEEEDDWD